MDDNTGIHQVCTVFITRSLLAQCFPILTELNIVAQRSSRVPSWRCVLYMYLVTLKIVSSPRAGLSSAYSQTSDTEQQYALVGCLCYKPGLQVEDPEDTTSGGLLMASGSSEKPTLGKVSYAALFGLHSFLECSPVPHQTMGRP